MKGLWHNLLFCVDIDYCYASAIHYMIRKLKICPKCNGKCYRNYSLQVCDTG